MATPLPVPAPVAAPVAPKMLKKEETVFIEVKSEQEGRIYNGDFTFRRLNLGQIAQVGVETSRLNGGLKVDENTDFINTMLATFKVAIVTAPEWWKPSEMFDAGIVATVYNKYLEFEASFRKAVQPQAEGSPKSS